MCLPRSSIVLETGSPGAKRRDFFLYYLSKSGNMFMYYLVLYALTRWRTSVYSASSLSKTALNCGLLCCMRLLDAMSMFIASIRICFCASLNILVLSCFCGLFRSLVILVIVWPCQGVSARRCNPVCGVVRNPLISLWRSMLGSRPPGRWQTTLRWSGTCVRL